MSTLNIGQYLRAVLILGDSSLPPDSEAREICLKEKERVFEAPLFYACGGEWVIRDGAMILFHTREQAMAFSQRNRLDEFSVRELGKSELDQVISQFHQEGRVRTVKIFTIAPFNVQFGAEEFLSILPMAAEVVTPPTEKKIVWNGVAQMKSALDTFSKEERQKIDPPLVCENIHTLVDFLLKQNYLDPANLDAELGLTTGTISKFCTNLTDDSYGLDFIYNILKYFGLESYLLTFKGNSREIRGALATGRNGHNVDRYSLKKGSPSSPETFKLTGIQRPTLKVSGRDFYIYQITLVSEARPDPVKIFISNPSPSKNVGVPCLVDKSYEVVGLEGVAYQNKSALDPNTLQLSLGKLDILQEEKKIVIQPDKVGRRSTLPEEEQYIRQEAVLAHIIKDYGCSSSEAIQKARSLAEDEEMLELYYQFTIKGKNIASEFPNRKNFSLRKLVKEMGYSFYDACILMIDLQDNDKKDATLAMLKSKSLKK